MPGKQERKQRNGEIFNIPPYLIKPNPALARTDFSDMSLLSLADSIKRYGILQPLAVRICEKGRYELIAGERRLRAAMLLHLPTVPCIILRNSDSLEYLSFVENIQRERLTMFDEARAVRRIYEKNGKDPKKTAKLLSISDSELLSKLRLCNFSRAEMQAVLSLGLTEKQAAVFLDVPPCLRYYTIKLCAEKAYSISETAFLCREIANAQNLSPDDLESFVSEKINTRTEPGRENPTDSPCGEKNYTDKPQKTVVLRDLRSFEISLRKICAILENAGCRTRIRCRTEEGRTEYTVTVDTEKQKG